MRVATRRALLVAAEIGSALLLIISILVTVVRVGLPQADRLHDLAEQLATEAVGQPVRIGALDTYWQGLNPSITLHDVELLDRDGYVVLGFGRADVEVDLFGSIAAGAVQFNELRLDGLNLIIEHGPDGLMLAGAKAPDAVDADDTEAPDWIDARAALAWLFAQRRIEVTSARVWWTGLGRPQVADVSLQVRNDGVSHRIGVQLSPGGIGGDLLLRGDLVGDPGHPEQWRGPLYLRGRGMNFGELLAALPAGSLVDAESPWRRLLAALPAEVDFMAWSRFHIDGPQRVVGRLAMHPGNGDTPAMPGTLEHAAARFDWERSAEDGWRLDLADVGVKAGEERALWIGPAAIAATADGTLVAGIGALSIDELAVLAAGLEGIDGTTREALDGLRPGGMLYRLSSVWHPEFATWQVEGEVWGAGISAWQRIPGVTGLRGAWRADPDGLDMKFDAYRVVAELPGLFRAPLEIDRVRGTVRLNRTADGWRLSSEDLELASDDLATQTRFRIDLPAGGSPDVDLVTKLRGNVAAKSRYLPVGIMAPNLVTWLDYALVDGRLRSGSIELRGNMRDFPFRDGSGTFEMRYEVDGATLAYHPAWPRIEELDGSVLLDGRGVRVDIAGGRIAGSRIDSARATIADATQDGDRLLHIEGQLDGTLADATRFLTESPLIGRFAGYLEAVQGEGPMRATLDIELPLRGGPAHIRGELDIRDARLTVSALGIDLEQVNGKLGFTEAQLFAEGLQAQWDGEPVVFDLQVPGRVDDLPVAVRVDGRGRVDASRLGGWLPSAHAHRVGGETAVEGTLGILPGSDGRPGDMHLDLRSQLRGLTIDLPAPLGKAADVPRPFAIEVDFVAGQRPDVSARYGEITTLRALLSGRGEALQVERAELRVGGAEARLPEMPGWRIAAVLDRVVLDDWLGLVTAGGGAAPSLPLEIELQTDLLEFGSLSMHAARLAVRRGSSGWIVDIDSDEIAGEIGLPSPFARGGVLDAKLERCLFRSADDEPGAKLQEELPPSPDPTTLPALYLQCERFRFDEAELGRMTAVAEPEEGGLRITRLEFDSPLLNLVGTGHWAMTANGPQTRLKLGARAPRLDHVLEAFAFQSPVVGGEARVDMDLGWNGAPYQMRIRSLQGALHLDIGEGELREVEPGVGRLFGLLSVATLGRRLQLDFSDLFQAGLVFDGLRGNFTLDAGEAYTSNFTLDAPSAEVVMMGRTGLTERDYDQLVTVTPHVSSSLPVVGALAGGPVVGAALLLFGQIFGSTIDETVSAQYEVTGSWDAPVIRRLLPGAGAPVETR